MATEQLLSWGFSEEFRPEPSMDKELIPARITEQHRGLYKVICEEGFMQASVSGKFMHESEADSSLFPAVGDWVILKRQDNSDGITGVIHHVLARKSAFIRKAAGAGREAQVVAANIDLVFLCMALNEDYNLRRMERYLSIAWDSGASPVVVLTKADLCADIEARISEVSGAAPGAEVIVCSAMTDDGHRAVLPYITPGRTVAFIGSSGVGKSTLINRLAEGHLLKTNAVREDGKGRHTTTCRQLILLPHGGIVIDTPGMRELGAVTADTGKSFSDIESLAARCRFHDCTHNSEPGCAVRAAIDFGELDEARYENYVKILHETAYSALTSKQIEEEKIRRMFGGKNEMKQVMREIKKKNRIK